MALFWRNYKINNANVAGYGLSLLWVVQTAIASNVGKNSDDEKQSVNYDIFISSPPHTIKMNKAETGITVTILFFIMFISLMGNVLVVLSYLISKRLRSYTHLLILNLAVSDLCITCLSLPLRICQLFGFDWSDGFTSCSVNIAFTIFFFTASNLNLFLVALDRYLGVIHPVKYRAKGSRRKIKNAIASAWIASFIIGFLPLTGLAQAARQTTSEKFICTFGTVLHAGYVSFVTIGTLLIPWVIMIAMYSRVLRVGLSSVQSNNKSNARFREGHPMPEKVKKREQRKIRKRANELRLARAVFLVLTLYTVCMVPIGVLDLIQILGGLKFPDVVIKIALMLAYINPAINPPIYAASIEHYRRAFLRLLVCRRWIKSLRGQLEAQRQTSYKNSYVGSEPTPVVNENTPWRKTLAVPGEQNGTSISTAHSNTSEFEGSMDDISYDDTTVLGGPITVLPKDDENSLKKALYTSTTTLLSIVLTPDEIDQYIFDYGNGKQLKIVVSESAM